MVLDLGGASPGHVRTQDGIQPRRGTSRAAVRMPGTTLRYEQVVALVEHLITERGLVPGDLLPSYTELADQAGVSLITVRRALDELERTGRVRRHQGVGTFVARPPGYFDPARAGRLLTTLVKDDKDGGPTASSTRMLGLCRGRPSADLCRALRIEPAEEVWRMRWLRLLDGKPAVLATSVIPVQLAPALDRLAEGPDGPHDLLATAYDLVEAYVEQYLEVSASTEEEAGLLELPEGTLVARIRGLSVDSADVPFDCFEKLYSARRFALAISGVGTRQLVPGPEYSDWRVHPQQRSGTDAAGTPAPGGPAR